MLQSVNETVELKFDVDDQKWAERLRAGEYRLLEMIAVFGVDIVVDTIRTHPMVVALTPA
jgi:hypothetical protein